MEENNTIKIGKNIAVRPEMPGARPWDNYAVTSFDGMRKKCMDLIKLCIPLAENCGVA